MRRISKCYGLLAGTGTYVNKDLPPLSGTKKDLQIMREALTAGLKFEPDSIRTLGDDGTGKVTARSFARALSEFEGMLGEDDLFLLYFSGHGTQEGLCFSDETVNLQSIVGFVERLPSRQKIVVLDCCFAGAARVQELRPFTFEKAVSVFDGRGMAVMASSAPDERAWLSQAGDASLYTCVAASALLSRRNIREGKLSLHGVNEEIRYLMRQWNETHPDRQQHPVFRENYVGEISFRVEEYKPYVPQKISAETPEYLLHSVKPLSTGHLKRLAAFIILKKADDSQLPRITKEIAAQFRNSEVYASARSEQRLKGRSADAIWCYFGNDEEDIARGNHFAYTIWTADDTLKKLYFRENRNAEVTDGIYIFWNTSYGLVKDLQKTDARAEELLEEYTALAGLLIGKAETFIKNLEEDRNSPMPWVVEVKQAFLRLSDLPPVPAENAEWAEAVLDLAGWVTDLAVLQEKNGTEGTAGEQWLVKNAIRRYREALERLRSGTIGTFASVP